jgi:hypothetical protein
MQGCVLPAVLVFDQDPGKFFFDFLPLLQTTPRARRKTARAHGPRAFAYVTTPPCLAAV